MTLVGKSATVIASIWRRVDQCSALLYASAKACIATSKFLEKETGRKLSFFYVAPGTNNKPNTCFYVIQRICSLAASKVVCPIFKTFVRLICSIDSSYVEKD
jgi:hypothetical protein